MRYRHLVKDLMLRIEALAPFGKHLLDRVSATSTTCYVKSASLAALA